jgi:Zn finger protein HypA/HybF involved in hydrogenase expression
MQQRVFREAIAAAKRGVVQGGGVIDDRVKCEHCGRKFRAEAALKHIPRCGEQTQRVIKF